MNEKTSYIADNKGFSLIEVSVALMIIGLIAVPLLMVYQNTLKFQQIRKTEGHMVDIKDMIKTYVQTMGRLPRPASLAATEGDPDYGAEGNANPSVCTSANWFTTDGMCRTTGANPALIGAVPFDALGLSPDIAHDYWNNRLLYAVTESQTDSATYDSENGAGIELWAYDKDRNIARPNKDDTAELVLVSTGPTARGGYTRAGVQAFPCVGGTPEVEDENCDMDNAFMLKVSPDGKRILKSGGTFGLTGAGNTREGMEFYDDYTDYQVSVPVNNWNRDLNINDLALSNAQRIGIGKEDPDSKIDVAGDVQATQNIQTDQMCDPSKTFCFNPAMIGGDLPEMDCRDNSLPNGEAVVHVGNNQVYCASPVDTGGTPLDGKKFTFPGQFGRINCFSTGQLMAGIDANGDPICITP